MTPTTRATARRTEPTTIQADLSDYGSDVDEDALGDLVSVAESQPFNPPLVLESIEEYNPLPQAAHIPRTSPSPSSPAWRRPKRVFVDEHGVPWEALGGDGPIREPSVEVEYDESNRLRFSPSKHRTCMYSSSSRCISSFLTADISEPQRGHHHGICAASDQGQYRKKTAMDFMTRHHWNGSEPSQRSPCLSRTWCHLPGVSCSTGTT